MELISKSLGIHLKNRKNCNIPAVKCGRETEGHTAEKCKEVLSGKEHENLSVKQCGLFLNKNYPFIGASPDRIM